MNIDWFTFTAQIVNFLVLVALLRWLLYGRIVRAMKKREEKIANRLEEANRTRADAEEEVKLYEEKTRTLDDQREELLEEARNDAREEHQRLLRESKEELDRKRAEWQEAYDREREDLLSDLRRQAGQLGLEAARRTLSQLAGADLEGQMCEAFAERMRRLGGEAREEIEKRLENEGEVSIRSAFAVPDERRERLRQALHETFRYDAKVSFEESTDLICGLELDIGGYSFDWDVREFLQDLELEFLDSSNRRVEPPASRRAQ
jgi:F-type H+-transporting ATPase subunit b